MDEIPLLHDIVVIFGLSIAVLLFMHRIHLPAVVGFLFTGILSGPHGFGLIKAESDVQVLANIGIVLLLFIVGMEFSFNKILEYRSFFFIGGSLQVFLTVLCGLAIGLIFNRGWHEALFFGFLLSLSSTAIVLRVLSEKLATDTPHGRVILGMMIFQDIIAIPMMLVTPLLCGVCQTFDLHLLWVILKGIGILGAVLFSAKKIVPWLLYRISKTRSRELFILTVFTICSSVTWVTSSLGLSLSLGAFCAGLIISESEYRTEAIGDILPFQDIFTSFFFVSIGMLLDIGFFMQQPIKILLITLGVLSLKFGVASLSTIILGMPLRTAVVVGLAMSQVGEFSFVLARTGSAYHLGSDYNYQLFLAVALLSMAVTPSLMSYSHHLANRLLKLPFPDWLKAGFRSPGMEERKGMKDHLVIVGFGLNGRNLAHAAQSGNIPYLVLEMNAETVKREKQRGEPIQFGDASHESVLQHAHITEAKVIAVVINDPVAAMRIVQCSRKLNPHVTIVVRTRYLKEMKTMYTLGADEVIPDEVGTSIELTTRVLKNYSVPFEKVQEVLLGMKIEGFEVLRELYLVRSSMDAKVPVNVREEKIQLKEG